jgi:predicted SAM-dependent methyltransferase
LIKINLGCGNDIKEGYINTDRVQLKGVDEVFDLNDDFPFKDDYADEVIALGVIEHVNDIHHFMGECFRILKKSGKLIIVAPHFSSVNSYTDPDHKRHLAINSLDFYVKGHNRNYYFDFEGFTSIKKKILFSKRWLYSYNYLVDLFVNKIPRMKTFYESSPLRVFPANECWYELIK